MPRDKKDLNIEIGRRLRRARMNLEYLQREAAEELNVTDEQYRKWESGASGMTVDRLSGMYYKLDFDCTYLVTGEKRDKPDIGLYLSTCSEEEKREFDDWIIEYYKRLSRNRKI